MEFVFAVREVLGTARQQLSFSIVDLTGQPLSHVIVNESGPRCGLQLQMLDGTPLALVKTEAVHERLAQVGTSVEFCRPSGETFGTLSKDEGLPCYRYVLRNKAWQRLYTYHGDYRHKAVSVTNAASHLVCTSERCRMEFDPAPHYQVRVAPRTDAGLVLCGLLAIDKLEGTGS